MIQITEPDDSDSLNKNTPIIHYRFNRKFELFNTHSQLYISESKLKIIVNCTEQYSKEIKSFSNSFSLYDLQNMSKYYEYFNKIEDVLENTADIFKRENYDVERTGHKLFLILYLNINEESLNVKLQLNINKDTKDYVNNNKKKVLKYRPKKTDDTDAYRPTKTSSYNVGVKSMNDLNNILTDLKDRLTVLEVNQNTNNNPQPMGRNINDGNRNLGEGNFLTMGNKSIGGNMNERILLNMEAILKRIDKLERENHKKSEKIELLKEKIKVYEPTITATSDNDSINDNNNFNFTNNYNNNNFNYNNYNNNDYNNVNQTPNFIDLGSIRNIDTSTIASNNSYLKNNLLQIKEEEINNSKKKDKNKNDFNFSDDDSYKNDKENKENNINKSANKNQKKGKSKIIKNKSMNDINMKDDNKNNQLSKKKGKSKGNKQFNNIKEEIINTNVNNLDNQNIINNTKKNSINNKNTLQKKKSSIKHDKNNNYENNNIDMNNNNNYTKKKSKLNKDNNNVNNEDNSDSNSNENNNINNNKKNKKNKNNQNNKEQISEQSEKININNQVKDNTSSEQISSESSKEKAEKYQKLLERKKAIDFEREVEAKEEKKRRRRALFENSSQASSSVAKPIQKSLTMAPKEDIRIYCKSHIIFTKDELRLLKKKINVDKKRYSVFFDVLYRASEDGDNIDIPKKIMEKEKRTLTLFQTEKGARFGIFVEKKLDTSILMNQYLAERPGTSFLVSLNNLEIYDIYKHYVSSENKLCFIKNKKKNRNGSSFAIYTPPRNFLGKICYMGDISTFFNIENNHDIIGEFEEYKLKEVEICKVSVEKKENLPENVVFKKSKTEIPNNRKNENKYSYGREYSFKNQVDSVEEEENYNEKREYNKEDEEKITNKLKFDYYDWGIIKGKNDN